MKTPLFLVALLIFAGIESAQARIGETVPECIERYGPIIEKRSPRLPKSDPEACVYSKAGISIIIEYRAGVAWNVRYRTLDLIVNQVTELLKSNMPEGGGWSAAFEVAGVQYRLAKDRRMVAAYNPGLQGELGSLEISSRDFNLAWREVYAAQLDEAILMPQAKADTRDLKGF